MKQSLWTQSIELIIDQDRQLFEIISLSLQVSGLALLFACLLALPLAALIANYRFTGKTMVVAIINALMGLPPVVVGLVVYLLLSRSGPLGTLGLLYTPTAMMIAQACLVGPLVTALAINHLQHTNDHLSEFFIIYRINRSKQLITLLWETRFALLNSVLAGFGRAVAEVGAVMIVGGNINHVTRVMTTSIALETSKGRLEFAIALGAVLVAITVLINLLVELLRRFGQSRGAL